MLLQHYPAHFFSSNDPLLYYKEASVNMVGGLVSFWQFFGYAFRKKSPYYVMNVTIYGEVIFQSSMATNKKSLPAKRNMIQKEKKTSGPSVMIKKEHFCWEFITRLTSTY